MNRLVGTSRTVIHFADKTLSIKKKRRMKRKREEKNTSGREWGKKRKMDLLQSLAEDGRSFEIQRANDEQVDT